MFFKKNFHHQTYQKDEDGIFKILVALRKYEDIYSDWDPSPFKKRDIEEDFIEYIWDSAIDIPVHDDFRIVFMIDENLRDEKKENQLLRALHNHFMYSLRKSQRAYFMEQKESFRFLVMGIILALFAYSDLFHGVDIWNKIFEEGIVIGTWVFFWEAFYNLFIEGRSIKEEQKIIKRFLDTEYSFQNK